MQVLRLELRPGQDAVAAWKAAGSPKEVALRLPGPVESCLGQLQPLGRRARVWLEAAPRDAEEALDWAVAGAAHLVFAWPLAPAQAGLAAEMGDLAAVVCEAADAEAAMAALPEAVVAVRTGAGYEVPEPAKPEAEKPEVEKSAEGE